MDLSWCGIAVANLEDVKNYLILNITFPITIYYHHIFLTAYNFWHLSFRFKILPNFLDINKSVALGQCY